MVGERARQGGGPGAARRWVSAARR